MFHDKIQVRLIIVEFWIRSIFAFDSLFNFGYFRIEKV